MRLPLTLFTIVLPSLASASIVTGQPPSTSITQQSPADPLPTTIHDDQVNVIGYMDRLQAVLNTVANSSSSPIPSDSTPPRPSIVTNGDFSFGDISGWRIDSPSPSGTWSAIITPALDFMNKPVLQLTVPADSYVMMFQDLQNTTTTKLYAFTFDYKFHSTCSAGSSLYYGAVSTEDLVDLEGDLELDQRDLGFWESFEGDLLSTTDGTSLYLYFMTKAAGGCTFSVDNIAVTATRARANQALA